MNRRRFLSMLGLAPVAACSAALPAIALPKPENPLKMGEAIGGIPVYDPRKEESIEGWAKEVEAFTNPQEATALRVDLLEHDLLHYQNWVTESLLNIQAELERLSNV